MRRSRARPVAWIGSACTLVARYDLRFVELCSLGFVLVRSRQCLFRHFVLVRACSRVCSRVDCSCLLACSLACFARIVRVSCLLACLLACFACSCLLVCLLACLLVSFASRACSRVCTACVVQRMGRLPHVSRTAYLFSLASRIFIFDCAAFAFIGTFETKWRR